MVSEASKYRQLDVAGKHVLDIGGFIGETAVLFHHWGARFVTLVEGVPENLPLIQANVTNHAVPHRLIRAFVGGAASTRLVRFHKLGGSFGLDNRRAPHAREIQVTPMPSMLLSAGDYDVVKCDCEGGEEGFLTTPLDLLRRASTYVIEIHGLALARDVGAKFISSGYVAQSCSEPRARNQVMVFRRV